MRIVIIGGFLGSGKTTTILRLGEYLSEQKKRVAIIVNEIGEIGLDGDTLSMSGITTKELTSGCICCTLKISMNLTLSTLAEEFRPDVVVIEPTGLAFPKQIRDEIESMGLPGLSFAPVVTIVDPSRADLEHQEIPRFIEIQIKDAQVLCINKTDIVGEDRILATEKALRELNPEAQVLQFSAKHEGKLETLLKALEIDGRAQEKAAEQNSIEMSEVASYSMKFEILSELDAGKARSFSEAVLESVRTKVAGINPDFIGHIKVSLKTEDALVKGSVTSATEAPQLEVLSEKGGSPARFKLLSAVTKVPYDSLVGIVESSIAEELEGAQLSFKKMTLPGHAHGHHGHHSHA